ncbi:unnamed protein product [Meganyctiphanes norvegica]|uniref:Uncharacterized protein n=1 Tax=Meganyctiphanes norvegica TaxID=48144 RepID=A0AAV2RZU8_MEGNR
MLCSLHHVKNELKQCKIMHICYSISTKTLPHQCHNWSKNDMSVRGLKHHRMVINTTININDPILINTYKDHYTMAIGLSVDMLLIQHTAAAKCFLREMLITLFFVLHNC